MIRNILIKAWKVIKRAYMVYLVLLSVAIPLFLAMMFGFMRECAGYILFILDQHEKD